MATAEKQNVTVNQFCENLANFSVDREDIKQVTATLPRDQEINTVTFEYELQLLKIIAAGWSLNVCLDGQPKKNAASEMFWLLIREFSKNISEMTHLTIGHEVDYFQLLKERFATYLDAMEGAVKNTEPTTAIGPAFASLCKHEENPFVSLSGARIFNMTNHAVKEYVASVTLTDAETADTTEH